MELVGRTRTGTRKGRVRFGQLDLVGQCLQPIGEAQRLTEACLDASDQRPHSPSARHRDLPAIKQMARRWWCGVLADP